MMDLDKTEQKDLEKSHEFTQKNIGLPTTTISHENMPEVKDST